MGFYAGDVANFHDGSPAAHASFEALLSHRREALADLGLSPSTLRNYIRAWEVWADLPEATRERLALHHLVALARVDPVTRGQLAYEAARGGWAVRQLDEAVEAWLQGLRSPGRGRPVLPKPVKAWGEVFAATRRAGKLQESLQGLLPKHRQRLEQELEAAVAELQATLKKLRAKGR